MNKIQVKFCGIKTVMDYIVCWQLGVNYVGFMCFASSPRAVTAIEVKTLIQDAQSLMSKRKKFMVYPEPKSVGVYVDTPLDIMQKEIEIAGFDIVQLYKHEYALKISVPYWKVFRIENEQDILNLNNEFSPSHLISEPRLEAVVLDTYNKELLGGTGNSFNWEWLKKINIIVPWFVAGGINVTNITKVLNYNPSGIDVSSGIEITKGKKSHSLMFSMINQIRKFYYY